MNDAERLRKANLPDLSGAMQTAKTSLYRKTIDFGGPNPKRALMAEPVAGPDASPRERLLVAGADLFAKHGLPNVTLEQIGAAAGLTTASIWHLCLSAEDLFHQVLVRQVDAFVAEAQKWVDPKVPAADSIRLVAEKSFAYLPQRPLMVQLVLGLWVDRMPAWAERLAVLRGRCNTGFADALKAGIGQRVFRKEISVEMVAGLLMDLHAASYLFAESGPNVQARVIQRRNAALDLIFQGLLVR